MKLATVNPELGFDIEQIISKQVKPPTRSPCLPLGVIFKYALFSVNRCLQMLLSQDWHLAFYGVEPGSSGLTGP
ncbi:Nuclear pore complex protein NUP155 [Zea mays]|uniref:Nuclear pore complex protein NUP155 n=1 Tax=Zea mays TaxID=4577 RepID=A0A1D6H3B0_MAIZE|nr:Nuclear pore complex protein NUP155 [Zea mays]